MKEFICIECGCTFRIAVGEGYPVGQQTCPNCRSINIQRIENKQKKHSERLVKEVEQLKANRYRIGNHES